MNTQSLKTAKQVGTQLGLSEVTVLRLFDAGQIEGIILRRGAKKRTIRFSDEAIEQFIAARAEESQQCA